MSVPAERGERLAGAARERGLDAVVVGDLVRPGDSGPDAIANVRWVTGFSGTSALAIVGPEERTFLTDFRYTERAEREVADGFERVTVEGKLVAELARRLRGRVGYDPRATSVHFLGELEDGLAAGVELVPAPGLVEELRRTKDDAEVAAIAAASAVADEAFRWLASQPLAGRTEREIARELEARLRGRGAEPSFPTIVAAGPNGALPHAEPTDRAVGRGELVVVDMGAKLDGYCSDGTRTFASSPVGEEEREVYELVLRAQSAALDAIRAGIGGAEADAVARELIAEAGHGERFGHGLGHGVGLEVHEAPRLGKTSEDELRAGDVVTVEPGVYVPGRFGVRIEDLVVVEPDGARNLSSTPKELLVAG